MVYIASIRRMLRRLAAHDLAHTAAGLQIEHLVNARATQVGVDQQDLAAGPSTHVTSIVPAATVVVWPPRLGNAYPGVLLPNTWVWCRTICGEA